MPSRSQSNIRDGRVARQARNKLLGTLGELRARAYLETKLAWSILDSNWHNGRLAEVDIIARTPENELSFIEVKTRVGYTNDSLNSAFDTINSAKRAKLLQAARYYLLEKGLPYSHWRFDLIVIEYPPSIWAQIYPLASQGLTPMQMTETLPEPSFIHIENALSP